MEDARLMPSNLIDAVKRRLPVGAVCAAIFLLLSLGLALGLPSVYKSRAVILIEQKEMPEDLVRSLVTSFADQRIQTISQRVLTNGNLSNIIEKYNLYPKQRAREPLEMVLKDMRDDIKVDPISADVMDPRSGRTEQATIAFELSYESRSADMAQKVANEIVSLFLNENLKERTDTANTTLAFLSTEAEKMRQQVSDLESKLAVFKEKNANNLPELQNVNIEMLNGTQREISDISSRIQSAMEQRVYVESELAQQKPTLANILVSDTGERIMSAEDRLKSLRSQIISLTSKYGPNYPDVVAARKEITSLEQSVGSEDSSQIEARLQQAKNELSADKQKYSPDHPDIKRLTREIESLTAQLQRSAGNSTPKADATKPDNPAYIQLQARLQAADAELRALNQQRDELRARQKDLEQRLASMPQAEKQYRALMRDYEIAQQKYHEILAKRQEADVAKNLESQQKGERLELIEPPVLPEEPSKPNRMAIGLLGVLLSFASGIGGGTLAETLDSRLYGRNGVMKTLGVAPLAVIPKIATDESRSAGRRRILIFAVIALAIVIAALVAVHLFVAPLDVLFFRAMRVFGS